MDGIKKRIADYFIKDKKPVQNEYDELRDIADNEDEDSLREFVASYDDEKIRFGKMSPVLVCEEIAKVIGGISTRIEPGNPESAPIALKEVNGIKYSVVYYKTSKTMSIYRYDAYCKGKKSRIVTTRNTCYGIKMAFENIRDGKIR